MSRIKILPEDVAQKIAAGEVIDRPASVVKELIENALDAMASKIEVHIEKGGIGSIRVRDDGCGMNPEDLKLCYLPHATSKIRSVDDLLRISTLGFRGEALASIAAVSRLIITSRVEAALWGAKLEVSFGKLKAFFETGAPKGTTVIVEDLFGNLPVRRTFLKSIRTETSRIVEIIKLIALGAPKANFSLLVNGRKYFAYQAFHGRRRLLSELCGVPAEKLIEKEIGQGPYKIEILISPPSIKFSTPRYIYFLVNGRVVKDKVLMSAFLHGARIAFPKGQYPAAVLAIDLPTELVDVNVHPAKWEVRFRQEREIFQLICKAVEASLKPEISFIISGVQRTAEEDIPIESEKIIKSPLSIPESSVIKPETSFKEGLKACERPRSYEVRPKIRAIGVLNKKYLLYEIQEGLLILDFHAAHERILYEEIKNSYETEGISKQPLLFPKVVALSSEALERLETHESMFRRLGYEFELAGPSEIRILSAPSLLAHEGVSAFIEILEDSLNSPPGEILKRVFATLACRAAVKAGNELSLKEAEGLLEKIQKEGLSTCPHGRPIFWKIDYHEIERRLGRKN